MKAKSKRAKNHQRKISVAIFLVVTTFLSAVAIFNSIKGSKTMAHHNEAGEETEDGTNLPEIPSKGLIKSVSLHSDSLHEIKKCLGDFKIQTDLLQGIEEGLPL